MAKILKGRRRLRDSLVQEAPDTEKQDDDNAERLAKKEALLEKRAAELDKDREELEDKKEELRIREKAIREAELIRKKGYQDERKKQDEELSESRKNQEKELADKFADKRKKGFEDIDRQLQEEREKRLELLNKEIDARRTELNKKIEAERTEAELEIKKITDSIKTQKDNLQKQEAEIKQTRNEQEKKFADLQALEKRLINREEQIEKDRSHSEEQIEKNRSYNEEQIEKQRSDLDELVRTRADKEVEKYRDRMLFLETECDTLRAASLSAEKILALDEDIKSWFGPNPESEIARLREFAVKFADREQELIEEHGRKMREAVDIIKSEKESAEQKYNELLKENMDLLKQIKGAEKYDLEINNLKDENTRFKIHEDFLKTQIAEMEMKNKENQSKIEQMKKGIQDSENRAGMIKRIKNPLFPVKKERWPSKGDEKKGFWPLGIDPKDADTYNKEISEIQWLDNIRKKSSKYGLKFSERVLYAFHTALKTAEWSILTVLAGVSGTGKSELPRMYAHFGGLNFLNVPVQPNWDSKESMLGFFNPIDNNFDAQPILRLLAQSQEEQTDDYPGLKDAMTLILLDEMNLAQVELYFAEFLSKLESRRDTGINNIETIDIPLGSREVPHKIELGRNVLWSGTMNQDETTKSLSDKVLDRGIIITFPRPKEFERRKELNVLGKEPYEAAPLLPYNVWRTWRCLDTQFTKEQEEKIKTYINIAKAINNSLAKVSRGLGHRVWQSIESYMTNYPTIIKALREKNDDVLEKWLPKAFEDQLAQKIMPKLQGIETRSQSGGECLKEIRSQLEKFNFKIVNDFDKACDTAYGQFSWNSNDYLLDEEIPPANQA